MDENIIKCKNCEREYSKKGIIHHQKTCNMMYSIKDELIAQYNSIKNYVKVAKIFHLREETVREYLHLWGIKFNNTGNYTIKRRKPPRYGTGIKIELNDDYFDIMDEIRYWILGLFAADGNVAKNNIITINQSGDNGKKLIDYIIKEFHIQRECRVNQTKCNPSYSISFSSKKILEVFKKFNIIPNKTLIYEMPDCIPDEYFSAYLAGYIEGDGCIAKYKLPSGNTNLIVSFVGTEIFMNECSKRIPINNKVHNNNHSSVKVIQFQGSTAIKFCEWLYSYKDLYHSYKYQNYIDASNEYYSSDLYYRRHAKEEVLKMYNSNEVNSYTQLSNKFNIKKDLIKKWFYKWYKNGVINEDYKYLYGT